MKQEKFNKSEHPPSTREGVKSVVIFDKSLEECDKDQNVSQNADFTQLLSERTLQEMKWFRKNSMSDIMIEMIEKWKKSGRVKVEG